MDGSESRSQSMTVPESAIPLELSIGGVIHDLPRRRGTTAFDGGRPPLSLGQTMANQQARATDRRSGLQAVPVGARRLILFAWLARAPSVVGPRARRTFPGCARPPGIGGADWNDLSALRPLRRCERPAPSRGLPGRRPWLGDGRPGRRQWVASAR